jgi:hypothetical protein
VAQKNQRRRWRLGGRLPVASRAAFASSCFCALKSSLRRSRAIAIMSRLIAIPSLPESRETCKCHEEDRNTPNREILLFA